MKKSRKNSRIEVWGAGYVTFPETRKPEDQGLVIVQLEPGSKPGDYIVEVVDNGKRNY